VRGHRLHKLFLLKTQQKGYRFGHLGVTRLAGLVVPDRLETEVAQQQRYRHHRPDLPN
jgi:hypothetical protein